MSAAIADGKPEAIINYIIAHSSYKWVASEEIRTEYREVLSRPKLKLSNQKRLEWQNLIEQVIQKVEGLSSIDFPRDPKDAKFLACAIASEADYLITGDKDFDDVRLIEKTTIISVSLFKKLFIDADNKKLSE